MRNMESENPFPSDAPATEISRLPDIPVVCALRETQIRILDAFLDRAVAFGWVNSAGKTRFSKEPRVWEFWQGVKIASALTVQQMGAPAEHMSVFDQSLFDRMLKGDIIKVARAERDELVRRGA